MPSNRTTHGMCGTRIYRIWKKMKSRCHNSNDPDYQKWYGSRGIQVCNEWRNNFQAFYDWAMSHGYSDELSIDRIDVDGNYCPENCRWIDMKTQARNKSDNRLITCNGETHCLSEWAEILGIRSSILRTRVYRGWDDQRIITQKIRPSRKE